MPQVTLAQVEAIGKRSIFPLESTTNRISSLSAFRITTQRLHTTTTREDMTEKVNLDGSGSAAVAFGVVAGQGSER